ncbi:vegetative cell wall protein gp1-like protein [Lates japonicus]|uniref:Vegetative cell wall protein gp1-like protein n=1 Tax=Lates japonicus TaxID=270547 RepID=A0AAD3MV42_LATJO|nr:vegetative cell wall protein gp1-like protein [Lates japonicus]
MDNIELILSICSTIYQAVENTKANKDRCQRVAQRVKALEELVLTIKQRGPGQISPTVDKALRELWGTLLYARDLITKYSKIKGVKGFLKSKNHEEQFATVNEKLTDNLQVLSGALQIEHGNILYRVYESVTGMRLDEVQPLTSSTTSMPPSMMPMSSPTAPMAPYMSVSSPTAPMAPYMSVSSPTAPTAPPMPTAPMPLAMSMSNPTPVYHPTTPVQYVVPPQPVSVPTAATVPVRCITTPMQVSRPMNSMLLTGSAAQIPVSTNFVSQHVPAPTSAIIMSPTTTAPMAQMPFTSPAAPMSFSPQNTSVGQTYLQFIG